MITAENVREISCDASDPALGSNPFSTRFVRPGALRYRFNDCDDALGQAKLDRITGKLLQRRCGLIVGPHGSGKTTLLHAIAPLLDEAFSQVVNLRLSAPPSRRPEVQLRHARRLARRARIEQTKLSEGGLFVVDGAEQLWGWDWSRLLRTARRRGQFVLATGHQPRRPAAILHRTHTTADLIRLLTQTLVSSSSASVHELVIDQLCERDLSTLTNVRDLWFEFYELVQPRISSASGQRGPKNLSVPKPR